MGGSYVSSAGTLTLVAEEDIWVAWENFRLLTSPLLLGLAGSSSCAV